MEEKLDKLVKDEWLWDYDLQDDELTIRYGLYSVSDTERVIDLNGKDLKQALLKSAENIRVDIESSLVDDNDFFGYDNAKDLEDRIVEETEYLQRLSELV